MLFVSRCVGRFGYAVVDTDDNIEEIVTKSELGDAVTRHGISIAGTVLREGGAFDAKWLERVEPYQMPEYMRPEMAKLLLVAGVELKVFTDIVTQIRVREIKQPVRINLSSFGSLIGDRVLADNKNVDCSHITLVFDDNVSPMKGAFWAYYNVNDNLFLKAKFDLSGIRDDTAAMIIYRQLMLTPSSMAAIDYIIDSDKRKKYMMETFLKGE